MYNIPNTPTWEANIQGVDRGELLEGDLGGNLNLSAEQLTHRTQWLYDNKVTGTEWQIKNTTYTAIDGDHLFSDTSGSSWTLTLPAAPTIGNEIHIIDFTKTWDVNNLTIARNGNRINGLLEDLVCDTKGCSIKLIYSNASQGWIVC